MQPDIRPARLDDAPALARLIDIAGEGMPQVLWRGMASPGESPYDVGARRAARREGGFSYTHAEVIERGGAVAALLLGYRQPDPYDVGDLDGLPAMIRVLVELEAGAPGSWYVNALAVRAGLRGQGLGSALLRRADALAREAGAPDLSLIVAEENTGAVALYRRHGYVAIDRRPLVPFEGVPYGGDWVLMRKVL